MKFNRCKKAKKIFSYENLLLLGVILIFWQIFSIYIYPYFNPLAFHILPAPSSVISTGWGLLKRGELFPHVLASLSKVLIGFFLAAILGISVGVLMSISKRVKLQMETLIDLLRPIPPFAWLPLILLWFGIGNIGAIFIIIIATIFPIIIHTVNGIENTKIVFVHAAQSLGCENKTELLLRILLPSALSNIVLGLRVGLGFSWRVLVGAEMIGSVSGLGYLILDSRNLGLPSLALFAMVLIGTIGYGLDFGIRRFSKLFLAWSE